jgi:hypothetical protein
LGTGVGATCNTYTFDAPDQRLAVNHWYHVAFTYRDADLSYHVRIWDATAGVLAYDVVGTAKGRLAVNSGPVVLGNLPLEERYFDGWLDEVVLFNDILTTAEIDLIRQGAYGKP